MLCRVIQLSTMRPAPQWASALISKRRRRAVWLLWDSPPGGKCDKSSGWQGDRLIVLTPPPPHHHPPYPSMFLSDWRVVTVCLCARVFTVCDVCCSGVWAAHKALIRPLIPGCCGAAALWGGGGPSRRGWWGVFLHVCVKSLSASLTGACPINWSFIFMISWWAKSQIRIV